MGDQGINRHLKDSDTVTILPAPPDTREEGVAWYEVQVFGTERRVRLAAFDSEGADVGTAETQLLNDDEARVTISEKDGQTLTATLTFTRAGEGDTRILVRVGGDEISITGSSSDPGLGSVQGRRSGQEQKLPRHWERLGDPLAVLADALRVRAADSNSWGCTSCLVLLGGVSLSAFACVEGALPACAGTLTGGATFIENCEGACA